MKLCASQWILKRGVTGVGIGLYQGSVLFSIVLETLSCEFGTEVPWELLYTDYLAVDADSLKVHSQVERLERMYEEQMFHTYHAEY